MSRKIENVVYEQYSDKINWNMGGKKGRLKMWLG